MEKKTRQKKAVWITLGATVLFLALSVILALGAEDGSPAGEISAWCLLLAGVSAAAFVVCLLLYLMNRAMTGAIVWREGASRPGRFDISDVRLQELEALFGRKKSLSAFERHMIADIAMNGDSQPAVVVSLSPLLVAAYSEDMDCVAMLAFPESLIGPYALEMGTRLLSVNYYTQGRHYVKDLIEPQSAHAFANLQPVIVDFLTDDAEAVAARKANIPEEDWQQAAALGQSYLRERPGVARSGDPARSYAPGKR